ncbi:nitrate- and nitrite sensing domain-containing protein [Parasphingorhabdus pacifica]
MNAAETPRTAATILDWRNWSLMVKFGAVVLVPLIFAISLGISQIQWQVANAGKFHRVTTILDTVEKIEPLVNDIQAERTAAVQVIMGTESPETLQARAQESDASAEAVDRILREGEINDQVVLSRHDDMKAALESMDGLRQRVTARQVGPPELIQAYSGQIQSVLALDRALTSIIAERSLSSSATAIQEMLVLMEEVRLQQAWVHTGLAEGQLSPQVIQVLVGSRARLTLKVEETGAIVAQHWRERLDRTMAGDAVTQRNAMLTSLVAASSDSSADAPSISPQEWNERGNAVIDLIDDGHNDLTAEVRRGAFNLEEEASNAAGRDSVFLISALLIAAVVIFMISRQLLGSLRELRRSALRSARHDLPEAVSEVRAGDDAEAAIKPVQVTTTEEVGQVARAFEAVNRQALTLAVEQATLRHGYSESFVGVSRRSQALLERQLRLFEQLEQDEEDPDQLARLFQLDHLATRMRRNNENLMVLSGTDLARRFARPTELSDVLRAAVSEIEQYPRVVLQPPPAIRLLGHVASDLVRLVAELLDNAANFSSPETAVTVSSYQAGDGSVTIDVLDEGIGMGQAELDEANIRLRRIDDNDLATSRRMGLFVAGRLAIRHDVTVELHGGHDVEGVRATVSVPPEQVVNQETSSSRIAPVSGGQRNGFAHHDMPTSGTLAPSAPESDQGGGGPALPQREPTRDSGSSLPQREPSSPDTGSSLPRREPSTPRPGMFDSNPAGPAQAPAEEDRPTETLFTPLALPPEQEGQPSNDPPFDWPFGADEPEPVGPPEPKSTSGEAFSTEWFQPSDQDAQYQAMADTDDGDEPWPGDANGSGGEFGSTTGSSWMTEQQPVPEPAASGPAPERASSLAPEGLPRRERQPAENDAAGDAAGEAAAGDGQKRSPEELSRQLADLQGGLQFGRTSTEISSAPESGAWNFATDDAWRQAEAAVSQDPSSYTDSGLPRRTPKAQLAPGSVSNTAEQSQGQRYQRDPEQLRGRLSSFQSGVERGRHRAPDEE